jgi:hypothetical protein
MIQRGQTCRPNVIFNASAVCGALMWHSHLRMVYIYIYIYIYIFHIWSVALYGAETWTLQKADQEYLQNFEVWVLIRMEKISWTDHM